MLLISIIICAVTSAVSLFPTPCKDSEPYHTSILSGEGWVLELLTVMDGVMDIFFFLIFPLFFCPFLCTYASSNGLSHFLCAVIILSHRYFIIPSFM